MAQPRAARAGLGRERRGRCGQAHPVAVFGSAVGAGCLICCGKRAPRGAAWLVRVGFAVMVAANGTQW